MNRRTFIKTASAISATVSPIVSSHGDNHQRTRNKQGANVLVLGGTGFFGPVLVNELINQGHTVTLFNRGKTNPHLFPDLPRIVGDRESVDGRGLSNLINGDEHWDWAVDTWQGSSKAVQDTANLLANRVDQYQYVSTVSVYDKWDRIGIDESEPLNPLPGNSEPIVSPNRYAIRKTFSEQILQRIMPDKTVFFRSHGMRGFPSTASRHEPYWQVKVARGEHLVLPSDIVHYQVTDMVSLARFMVHCGISKINGPFNVAYPPFLFRDFIEEIVSELKSEVKLHWIPQEFLLEHNVTLMRATPPGRYRFSVQRAIDAGLVNRPLSELLDDQLKGYKARNPNDDFVFGKPKTATISAIKEQDIIEKWSNKRA